MKSSSSLCGEFKYKLLSIKAKDLVPAESIDRLRLRTQEQRERYDLACLLFYFVIDTKKTGFLNKFKSKSFCSNYRKKQRFYFFAIFSA